MKVKILLFLMILLCLDITSCRYKRIEVKVPYVAEKNDVYIDSKPTEAVIFINGEKIGKTPLVTKFWFTEESKVKITAMPVYKDQFRQDIVLTIPAIPKYITFFMTNKPKDIYTLTKNPEVPEPQIAEEKVPEVIREVYPSPTVYFALNETFIDEKQIEVVKIFAGKIQGISNIRVLVHGFADESGDRESNRLLSLKRAEAVSNILTENGISVDIITLFGHGEIYTVNNDGLYLEASVNRKVEIKVETDEENKPEPENSGN